MHLDFLELLETCMSAYAQIIKFKKEKLMTVKCINVVYLRYINNFIIERYLLQLC